MAENKRIIIVYPHNFLQRGMGTNNRVYSLASIMKELGYRLDLFAFSNFMEGSSFDSLSKWNSEEMIENFYIYDFDKKRKVVARLSHVFTRTLQILKGEYLNVWVTRDMKREFDQIICDNEYDCIITFYSIFAPLFENIPRTIKKVYFMEDCLFLQKQNEYKEKRGFGFSLGKLIDSDLKYTNIFDHIFCISNDEKIMYSKMLGRKMDFLPHLLPERVINEVPYERKKYDLFFIGFDNPYNREALLWFLDNVYNELDKNISILLAGSMTKCICDAEKYENIEISNHIDDLDQIYPYVKVVMCPMRKGTGMKIKIVEAMQYGIPIVCTERGVDGLPDKTENGCFVTDDPLKFAYYINHVTSDEKYYAEASDNIKRYYKKVFDRQKYVDELRNILN